MLYDAPRTCRIVNTRAVLCTCTYAADCMRESIARYDTKIEGIPFSKINPPSMIEEYRSMRPALDARGVLCLVLTVSSLGTLCGG